VELSVRDALGRELHLARPPERIVSLVPSHTETLFALGAGSRVVGVTDFCVHPADALRGTARIGGTKTPELARLRALAPDLVIANREENRRIDVRRLEAAGVPVLVTYARTVDEAAAEIELLGRICGCGDAAAALCAAIAAELARGGRAAHRVRAVALIWKQPYMAVGGDCFAHDLLGRAGGENPFGGEPRRYPHVDAARIAAAAPEVILLPTEPYAFGAADRDELLSLACPAARSGRIHVIEGELLTWYGPRIPRALAEIGRLLHLE
jgi:ABC-type Fe3+-hydroxamate transport system substrate-binding protein